MGAVNTTYTFTATDTITSTKMNNIIDETVMTGDAVLGGSGGSGGLDIASGKLSISANAINSSRLATNSVTSDKIVDGTNDDINASAAIAGTKISPNFGTQNIVTTGTIDVGTSSLGGTFLKRTATPNEGGDLTFAKAIDNTAGFIIDCFGSTSSPDLRFISGSSVAATLTTSGNVGVGTTSPSYKLDVNGDIKSRSGWFLGSRGTSGFTGLSTAENASSGGCIIVRDDNATYNAHGVEFYANSTERMRITANGDVGIGTSFPGLKFHVVSGNGTARFESNTNNNFIQLFTNEGLDNRVEICNRTGGRLALYTTGGGDALNVLKTGEVGIGTTTPSQKLDVNGTTKSTKLFIDNTSNDDKVFIKGFNNNNTDDGIRFVPSIVTAGDTAAACSFMSTDGTTLRGTISILTNGVNYGSASDYRLKSDIVPISEALQQLQQLNPVNFEWVENRERSDGFIAHEVQAVVPNAVTGAKDAVDANGNPIYQQVDYSKLVPILVASVQELKKKVAELESR
jgi:hypothetical protein